MDEFIGIIKMFGGTFAPRGWALCNGQIMSIAQNTALFSILGTTYGGNGQTTFALPNLQGRVPIHPGQGAGLSPYSLGEVAGGENETLTIQNMPAHNHVVQIPCNAGEGGSATPSGGFMGKTGGDAIYAAAHDNNNMGAPIVSVVGGSQPFSIIQPFLCVNFIICLEGLYPSRN